MGMLMIDRIVFDEIPVWQEDYLYRIHVMHVGMRMSFDFI